MRVLIFPPTILAGMKKRGMTEREHRVKRISTEKRRPKNKKNMRLDNDVNVVRKEKRKEKKMKPIAKRTVIVLVITLINVEVIAD